MTEINTKRLFKMFKDMAEISSPSWKEGAMISYLKKIARHHGFKAETYPCKDSFNLLLRIKGSDPSKKKLLFSAHTDTVTPCDNIKIVEDDKTFKSDGTTILGGDDKAGIAAILEALITVKEKKIPHGDIELLFTCAEEVGLFGMKGMAMDMIQSEFCFVLDSGGPIGSACVKAPYHLMLNVVVKGKAAHAGMEPEKGVNAIVAMSRMIAKLPNGRIDEETTTNVGVVKGGNATNIVTPEASFALEVRSLNKKKMKSAETRIRTIIKEEAKAFGARVSIDSRLAYSGYEIKESSPLIKLFSKACARTRLKPVFEASGGGSDTNILNAAGHKALNLSAGMNKVHTTAEFLRKKDLEKSAMLCVGIIEES